MLSLSNHKRTLRQAQGDTKKSNIYETGNFSWRGRDQALAA